MHWRSSALEMQVYNRNCLNTPAAVHLGVEPNRIDLLTHLEGMNNNTVFNNIEQTAIEGTTVNIICRADLILAKKTSRRLRDQADAEELEKLSGE